MRKRGTGRPVRLIQASKLKHYLDKRVSNFLTFSSYPAQSKLMFCSNLMGKSTLNYTMSEKQL